MLITLIALALGVLSGLLLLRTLTFALFYFERWITYGRPNVFPRPKDCPRCGNRIVWSDSLRTVRHALIGGWTCRSCGSEFDQLNNCRIARAWNANLRDLKDRSLREVVLNESRDTRSPVEKIIDE